MGDKEKGPLDENILKLPIKKLISVEKDKPLRECISLMGLKNISSLSVVENNQLIGIFSIKDLIYRINWAKPNLTQLTAKDLMNTNVTSIDTRYSLGELINLMVRKDFRHYPILNEEKLPAYMVSARDILIQLGNYLFDELEDMGSSFDGNLKKFLFHPEAILEDDLLEGARFLTRRFDKCEISRCHIVSENISILDAIELMKKHQVDFLVVEKYGTQYKGIISEKELLIHAFNSKSLDFSKTKIDQILTPIENDVLIRTHKIGFALNNIIAGEYLHIVVLDEDLYPTGVISIMDLIEYIYHCMKKKLV